MHLIPPILTEFSNLIFSKFYYVRLCVTVVRSNLPSTFCGNHKRYTHTNPFNPRLVSSGRGYHSKATIQ